MVAVVGVVGVAVAGAIIRVIGRGGKGLAADLDIPGCGICSCVDFEKIRAVKSFPGLGGDAIVGCGACVLSERVDWIWCCNWTNC